jgi:microcystin-dependent protein
MTILVGTILSYGATVAKDSPPPDGWLYCDGSAVSRTSNPVLFSTIGTLYGGGDGSTTFNLPDYRGYFLRGVDDGAGIDLNVSTRLAFVLGAPSGSSLGTLQKAGTALPYSPFTVSTTGDHVHEVNNLPNDNSWYPISGSHYASWNAAGTQTDVQGDHSHTFAGGDLDSCPKNLYVNYIIYAGGISQ